MDAATGLLYVGNGQYYDPETGRFLTRDAKPNNSNPYVPWDPTGAIVGPLGVAALFFARKKKGNKVSTFFILLLVVGSVGMTLAACQTTTSGNNVTATPSPVQPNTYTVTVTPATVPGSTPTATGTPMPEIKYTCTVTPIPSDNLDLYFASLPEPYAKMPAEWTTSERGIEFIKYYEGPGPTMYNDAGNNCTIGHGHLVHPDRCGLEKYRDTEEYWKKKEPLSLADADLIMRRDDLPVIESVVRRYINVKLTQTQWDALVSLVYNWNEGDFSKSPKITLLNSGQYVATANHFNVGPITTAHGTVLLPKL